jgi:hypothetical protein
MYSLFIRRQAIDNAAVIVQLLAELFSEANCLYVTAPFYKNEMHISDCSTYISGRNESHCIATE